MKQAPLTVAFVAMILLTGCVVKSGSGAQSIPELSCNSISQPDATVECQNGVLDSFQEVGYKCTISIAGDSRATYSVKTVGSQFNGRAGQSYELYSGSGIPEKVEVIPVLSSPCENVKLTVHKQDFKGLPQNT